MVLECITVGTLGSNYNGNHIVRNNGRCVLSRKKELVSATLLLRHWWWLSILLLLFYFSYMKEICHV